MENKERLAKAWQQLSDIVAEAIRDAEDLDDIVVIGRVMDAAHNELVDLGFMPNDPAIWPANLD